MVKDSSTGSKDRSTSYSTINRLYGLCISISLITNNNLLQPFFLVLTQLVEAIVLPMTHKERFENLGIAPPKGTEK